MERNHQHANDTTSSRLVLFPGGSTSYTSSNSATMMTTTHTENETSATTMGLSATNTGKTIVHPDRTNMALNTNPAV